MLCFAPWIACPPCCLQVLTGVLGSAEWLVERWIGLPSSPLSPASIDAIRAAPRPKTNLQYPRATLSTGTQSTGQQPTPLPVSSISSIQVSESTGRYGLLSDGTVTDGSSPQPVVHRPSARHPQPLALVPQPYYDWFVASVIRAEQQRRLERITALEYDIGFLGMVDCVTEQSVFLSELARCDLNHPAVRAQCVIDERLAAHREAAAPSGSVGASQVVGTRECGGSAVQLDAASTAAGNRPTPPVLPDRALLRSQRFRDLREALLLVTDAEQARQWTEWCFAWHLTDTPAPAALQIWDTCCGRSCTYYSRDCAHTPFQGRCLFVDGDMITHAAALAQEGHMVCMLNMACASRAGGGYVQGCLAQEEVLCHRTLLFPRLCISAVSGRYPIPPGAALFTPDVHIVRDAPALQLQSWVSVHVVSAAAKRLQSEAEVAALQGYEQELCNTWRAVIAAAHDAGASVLVVSALGCGAYCNPPEVVGRALRNAVSGASKRQGSLLAAIHMVVHDDRRGGRGDGNVARMRAALQWEEAPQRVWPAPAARSAPATASFPALESATGLDPALLAVVAEASRGSPSGGSSCDGATSADSYVQRLAAADDKWEAACAGVDQLEGAQAYQKSRERSYGFERQRVKAGFRRARRERADSGVLDAIAGSAAAQQAESTVAPAGVAYDAALFELAQVLMRLGVAGQRPSVTEVCLAFKRADAWGLIMVGAPPDEYDQLATELHEWLSCAGRPTVAVVNSKLYEVFEAASAVPAEVRVRVHIDGSLRVFVLELDQYTQQGVPWRPEQVARWQSILTQPSERPLLFFGTEPALAEGCLSNFARCTFVDPDIAAGTFLHVEQYMHLMKALLFADGDTADAIAAAEAPGRCRRLGRAVLAFDDDAWASVALRIVERGVYLKFVQNPLLRRYLLSTEDRELVEASPYDARWGIGFSADRAMQVARSEWGANWLGQALMGARTRLKLRAMPPLPAVLQAAVRVYAARVTDTAAVGAAAALSGAHRARDAEDAADTACSARSTIDASKGVVGGLRDVVSAPFAPSLPSRPPLPPPQPPMLVETTGTISCANQGGDAGDADSLRYVPAASHPTFAIGGDARPVYSASASHAPSQMRASAAGATVQPATTPAATTMGAGSKSVEDGSSAAAKSSSARSAECMYCLRPLHPTRAGVCGHRAHLRTEIPCCLCRVPLDDACEKFSSACDVLNDLRAPSGADTGVSAASASRAGAAPEFALSTLCAGTVAAVLAETVQPAVPVVPERAAAAFARRRSDTAAAYATVHKHRTPRRLIHVMVDNAFAVAGAFASTDGSMDDLLFGVTLLRASRRMAIADDVVERAFVAAGLLEGEASGAQRGLSSFLGGGGGEGSRDSGDSDFMSRVRARLGETLVTRPAAPDVATNVKRINARVYLQNARGRTATTSVAIEVDRSQRAEEFADPALAWHAEGASLSEAGFSYLQHLYTVDRPPQANIDDLSQGASLSALEDAMWGDVVAKSTAVPTQLVAAVALARPRPRFQLCSLKGKPYSRGELGVWRRLLHLWDARIIGWLTAAERVKYIALANAVYSGSATAFAALHELRTKARYSNGRLPGCGRYSSVAIARHYKLKRVVLEDGASFMRAIPTGRSSPSQHPLADYNFRITQTHHLVLRGKGGRIPMAAYLRIERQPRCLFGAVEKPSLEDHEAQRERCERRVEHYRHYVKGFTLHRGIPVMLQNGGLPAGFGAGTQRVGIAVAILDSDPQSHSTTNYFKGAVPPVTVTCGNALNPGDRQRALDTHPHRVHVATMSTLACDPHTTMKNLRIGQASERSAKTTSACHAMDLRDFERTGAIPYAESVVGSIAAMRGYEHTLVNGRHTGELTEDKHAIYHITQFKPLIDRELDTCARLISQRSCAGRLRPVQHLGLDDVPVIKGTRDPSDPTKWLQRSRVCCDGDTYCIWGNLPDGVTRRDWCDAVGIDPEHVTLLYQLRNALWPRLGALLSTQAVMYYMAFHFGFPVVEYTEAVSDALLGNWVHSLLYAPVWPKMPFKRVHLLAVPVNMQGAIVLDVNRRLLAVEVPKQTSTFKRDVAAAFTKQYAPLVFPAEHFRFVGMFKTSAGFDVVFCTEFLDDRSRDDMLSNSLQAASPTAESEQQVPALSVTVTLLAEHLKFLQQRTWGGRTQWSYDALIIRDAVENDDALRASSSPALLSALPQQAHICISEGYYRFVPRSVRLVHTHYAAGGVDARVSPKAATAMLVGAYGSARGHVHRGGAHVSALQKRNNAAREQADTHFDNALARLSAAAGERSSSTTFMPSAPVRVLSRPDGRQRAERPAVDRTIDRTYNSIIQAHLARYKDVRESLGVLGAPPDSTLGDGGGVQDTPSKARTWYSGARRGELCVVLWRGYVVLRAHGSRLSFLGDSSARITRRAYDSLKLHNAQLNRRATGLARTMVWQPKQPTSPVTHDELETLYRHECALRRGAPTTASERASRDKARAFMNARAMPTYQHHALQEALRCRANEPGAARTFSAGAWRALQVDETCLLGACVEAAGGFYVLERVALTHNVAIVESVAHGMSAALQEWLELPLHQLRHHGTCEADILSARFRQWRLSGSRWNDVRASHRGPQRAIRRLASMSIDKASRCSPFAEASFYVIVSDVAERFVVKQGAHFIELPDALEALPSVERVPCTTSSSGLQVDRQSLEHGKIYLCDPALLREHFAATHRTHFDSVMQQLVDPAHKLHTRSATLAGDAGGVATAATAIGSEVGSVRPPCPAGINTAVWAALARATIDKYVALCGSPEWGVREQDTQWFDLVFDERFLAAMHRHAKDVESRFASGAYRQIRPGMLVRCRVTPEGQRHGRDPARHYQSWWFVADVVKARSFYALYQRFTSRLLPGRPHQYREHGVPTAGEHVHMRLTRASRARVINAFVAWRHAASGGRARAANLARPWTGAEVEHVFHSIYRRQYPTLEEWRASQQGTHPALGLVLLRLPQYLVLPVTPAVNARENTASAAVAYAAAERHVMAARVLQQHALRWLRARRAVKRRADLACARRVALLNGRVYGELASGHSARPAARAASWIEVLRLHALVIRIQVAARRRLRGSAHRGTALQHVHLSEEELQCYSLDARLRVQNNGSADPAARGLPERVSGVASSLVHALLADGIGPPAWTVPSFLGWGRRLHTHRWVANGVRDRCLANVARDRRCHTYAWLAHLAYGEVHDVFRVAARYQRLGALDLATDIETLHIALTTAKALRVRQLRQQRSTLLAWRPCHSRWTPRRAIDAKTTREVTVVLHSLIDEVQRQAEDSTRHKACVVIQKAARRHTVAKVLDALIGQVQNQVEPHHDRIRLPNGSIEGKVSQQHDQPDGSVGAHVHRAAVSGGPTPVVSSQGGSPSDMLSKEQPVVDNPALAGASASETPGSSKVLDTQPTVIEGLGLRRSGRVGVTPAGERRDPTRASSVGERRATRAHTEELQHKVTRTGRSYAAEVSGSALRAAQCLQAHCRRWRATRHANVLRAQKAIIMRLSDKIKAQARIASSKIGLEASVANEELLREAGRKARAYMAKAARPVEKVMADCFLDAIEAQLRGDCTPLGDNAVQCSRTQSMASPGHVTLDFKVSSTGHVGLSIGNNDDAARREQARKVLDLFEAARKSGIANQRAERSAAETAYRAHLTKQGFHNTATAHAVPPSVLRTARAAIVLPNPTVSAGVDLEPDFEVTSEPGIQSPVYLRGIKACGKGGVRQDITCLLMGDSGSGTCIIGEDDFLEMELNGTARKGRKLPSSVEQIAGIGAVNLVLYYATFMLDFGGAIVRFTDVPVLSGHQGILVGNDFHRVTRSAYDFDRCTDEQGQRREGHVILRNAARQAVSKRIYFSHRPGAELERTATSALVQSAVPLVYNPEALTVPAWSEAMLRVRVPAAAIAGHDIAVLPLDDDRLENLSIMVAPSLARPDAEGYIWIRVINPAQRPVRISQLTPLARFVVDPKITDSDLEFSVEEIVDKIHVEPGCTDIHRDDIKRMLATRRRLFASKLGWAHGYRHDIDIDASEIPPALPARRLSPEEYTALKEAIDKQFKAGLLEYCTSPYNARPMCIPKHDGGHRVVIDYRLVNEQIIRSRGGSSYPLPNVESNLNSLAKAKWFTAIDLLSGFHQVELTDRAKLATAFSTPWGQMCYSRLPMGLTSSPGAFMMVVDSALRGLPPGIAVAYVDDILIPTDGDWDDHMRDVGLVMDRLIEAGFTVNPKKVFMGMKEVPYLGYCVGAFGTRPNPERTKTIFDLVFENIRTDPGAAARFTGMISFYARFIKNLHITLAPFHMLKAKGANANAILNSLQLRASFELLKHQLATVTALTRPDYNKDFHIHVDMASSVGIGAALMQLEDPSDPDSLRPVAFWSHKFTDNEKGWSVRDQECYGLIKALEEWRPYVLGSHTCVRSDHKSLQWFMHTAHADGTRIQSWVARIQHFDINIKYIPGKDHVVADFFSRAVGRTASAAVARGVQGLRVDSAKQSGESARLFLGGGRDSRELINQLNATALQHVQHMSKSIALCLRPTQSVVTQCLSAVPHHGAGCSTVTECTKTDRAAHGSSGNEDSRDKPVHKHCRRCGVSCLVDRDGTCSVCRHSLGRRGSYNGIQQALRLQEIMGYDPACAGCKYAHDVSLCDMTDALERGLEHMQPPHAHCHHCGAVVSLQSRCTGCSQPLTIPADSWTLLRSCRTALTTTAVAIASTQRTGLFIPVWSEGVLHAVVCTYQEELLLPAVEAHRRTNPQDRSNALQRWIKETFVPAVSSHLCLLLANAQYIGPQSDPSLPAYFVSAAVSGDSMDLECYPTSGFKAEVLPLHVGALPDFSVAADKAFCLRYISKATRSATLLGASNMEWRFNRLHGRVDVPVPCILDGCDENSASIDASYVRCTHGWVHLRGDPDPTVKPVCRRVPCRTEAFAWFWKQRVEGVGSARTATTAAAISSSGDTGDGLPRIGDKGVTAGEALFCDTLDDIVVAEQRLHSDVEGTALSERVTALDLEGNLGGNDPHIALLQIKSEAHLFVVDTHVVSSALSPRARGLRTLLEDSSVVKVVHSCYGDASALAVEHGIQLAGSFDTAIADAILRGASPNASRGLGVVLTDWLGDATVHLTHKGKLVFIPFMFNKRPLSREHFVYSAEDVEYCIALHTVMRRALEMRGFYELACTLSNDRCTPVQAPGTPQRAEHACHVAIAIVDSSSVVCIECRLTGQLALPSAVFDPHYEHLPQRELKRALRDAWVSGMGTPPAVHRFATTISAQIRKPKRIGSYQLAYGLVPDIASVQTALESAFADGPAAMTHRLRVVPRFNRSHEYPQVLPCQQAVFQAVCYDTTLGLACPKSRMNQVQIAARKGAAICIQRHQRSCRARKRVRDRSAHVCAAVAKSMTTFERGALVLLDTTYAYVLTGASESTGWRFPWASVGTGSTVYDAAIAGFDRYAGPAARKGSAEIDFSSKAVGGEDRGWCLLPTTSARIRAGLDNSELLGRKSKTSSTHFTMCPVAGLGDIASALVASRHETNGFRLAPTEHKRHPVAMLATHATALKRLEPEDAWALQCAIDKLKGTKGAATRGNTVPCEEQATELKSEVQAATHVAVASQRDSELLVATSVGDVELRATTVKTCSNVIATTQQHTDAVDPYPPLVERTALRFEQYTQDFEASRVAACAFSAPGLISDMLGYTVEKLDKTASNIQARVEEEISTQLKVKDTVNATEEGKGGLEDEDSSRHSGRTALPRILEGVEGDDDGGGEVPLPVDIPVDRDEAAAAGVSSSLHMPSLAAIAAAQREHPAISMYIDYLIAGVMPPLLDSAQTKAFITEVALVHISLDPCDGEDISVLRRIGRAGARGPVVLPPQYRQHVFQAFHDKQGHLGVGKIWPSMRRMYWWPQARDELRSYIKLCRICRRIKIPRHQAGEQHITHHGSSPWTDVTLDVYDVGWPSGEFTKIVSFNDHLGRGVLSVPLKTDYTAENIADIVVGYVIRFKGRPLRMHSDRGSTLIAEVVHQLYTKYEIVMKAGMAYNHNSAALTERWHSVLKALLATHRLASKDDQWHLYLPLLELAYNDTINATTGFSPFFVEHLRHADVPTDLSSGRPHHGPPLKEHVQRHIERAQLVWAVVAHELDVHALNAKAAADLKREHKIKYFPGQQVLLVRGEHIDGNLPKVEDPTEGPFTVLRALAGGQYVLGDLRSKRMHDVVTEKRLVPYPSRRLNSAEELAARHTVDRIVDRKLGDDGQTLYYRIRWSGFSKNYDSWRSMEYLHEVAPLVAAYNRLVPLPETHQPLHLSPVDSDVVQPPPQPEALRRRHFRPLDGGNRAPPAAAPNSDDLLTSYAVGTRVEMLYSEEGVLAWYRGTITRCSAALSRDRKPDLSFSLLFDGDNRTYGPYKLSCNSLRLMEDAPEDIAFADEPMATPAPPAPEAHSARRSSRLNPATPLPA